MLKRLHDAVTPHWFDKLLGRPPTIDPGIVTQINISNSLPANADEYWSPGVHSNVGGGTGRVREDEASVGMKP